MATRKTPLRAVQDGEKPPAAKKPGTVTQAAEDGTRLDELKAMRLRVARAIDDPNTPARDLAALTRRQIEMGKEIEAIEKAAEEDAREQSEAADEEWDESAI